MSQRIAGWWQSLMSVGTPIFPYVGLVLLIILGVLALCVVLYLLYRLFKRLPPIVRYSSWRIATTVRRLFVRKSSPRVQQLLASFAGSQAITAFEYSFSDLQPWPWQRMGRRPNLPLFLVLGPANSGKSELLRMASNGLSQADGYSAARQPDVIWWPLQNRLALEIQPRLLAPSSQAQLTHLLDLLEYFCPGRPMDGVIVTLTAEQLLKEDISQNKELIRVAEAVTQICAASGHLIPVYLVITGGENLAGFSELAELSIDRDITADLNWNSVTALEQPDVEMILSAWCNKIRSEVLFNLTGGLSSVSLGKLNPILQLPAQVTRLRAPLLTWLKEFNVHTLPSQGRAIFRGVFLTGLGEREPDQAAPQLQFISSAVRDTLFSEGYLAQPTPKYANRIRRRVLIASAALAASVVLFAIWIPNTLSRVRENVEAVRLVVQKNKNDLLVSVRKDKVEPTVLEDPNRLTRLLSAVDVVSNTSLKALLAPLSWFDNKQSRLLSIIGDAIQHLVIEPRLEVLAHDMPRVLPESLLAARNVSAERVEELPAYGALLGFLNTRELSITAVQTAESLPNGITYRDLTSFVANPSNTVVADGVSVSDAQGQGRIFNTAATSNPPWDPNAALPSAVTKRFDTSHLRQDEEVQPVVKQLVASYLERLLRESFDNHPVVLVADETAGLINRLARDPSFSLEDAENLADCLRRLQREASQVQARRLLGKTQDSLSFFGPVMARLGNSSIVSIGEATDATNAFRQRRDVLRRHLLTQEIVGVGSLFMADPNEGNLVLTAEVKRFSAAYNTLMSQSFMQRMARGSGAKEDYSNGVTWNLSQLSGIKDLASAVRTYSTEGVQGFDASLRPSIMRLTQAQFKTNVDGLFWQAAMPLNGGNGDGKIYGVSDATTGLSAQVNNLTAAIRLYRLAFNADEGVEPRAGTAGELLISETQRLLERLDARLSTEDPYASMIADVRRWMTSPTFPGRPLGNTMRGNPKERLALAREFARSQYGVPVALLLDGLTALSPASIREETMQRRRRFLDVLESFDKGTTTNGLYELEQYILNLAKWNDPDECVRFLAERAPTSWRSDYFSMRFAALDEPVTEACTQRVADGRRRKYEEFASWFNTNVAGHQPFGSAAITPLSRRSFSAVLARYRDLRKQLPVIPTEWTQSTAQFFDQMDALSERFGTVERNKSASAITAEPADGLVQGRLSLRTNSSEAVLADQIIDASVQSGSRQYGLRSSKDLFEWRIGDPIEVRLRWAALSPYVPVTGREGKENYSVSDRTVTFKFTGDWALFDLLRRHAVRGDGYGQVVLRFNTQVVGPQGRRVAQFFATLAAPTEQIPFALDFPESAPALSGSSRMDVSSLKLD